MGNEPAGDDTSLPIADCRLSWLQVVSATSDAQRTRGGESTEAAMRPPGVVFVLPVFDDGAGFGERPKLGDVQQLAAGSSVERLDLGVLPGGYGFDVDGVGPRRLAPLTQRPGDQLGPIVHAVDTLELLVG
jgi:hypothetical protein